MARIYVDEAITGTKIDKRLDFQRLINDCMNGYIDMIITKSISRCTGIKKSSEGVSFSSMKGNEKIQFEIALLDNRDYAMEVNVYEHN